MAILARIFCGSLAFSLFSCSALAAIGDDSAADAGLPRLVEQNGRYALMVDGAPFLVLAAQVNNSSAWPASMPKVWPTMVFLRVNTVEAPVYWERLEPKPGEFNF